MPSLACRSAGSLPALLTGLVTAASCLLLPSPGHAATHIVAPDGSGDFTTIQAAIQASASGDEIIVQPGTYVENLNFQGKNLIVRGAAGATSTTLDGGGGPPGQQSCALFVSGEGTQATLEGFTLRGGHGTNRPPFNIPVGGAILCHAAGATIRRCVFEANEAQNGGAIFFYIALLVIEECRFAGNISASYGSAISGSAGSLQVRDTVFEGNTALEGDGAVSLAQSTQAVVERCLFLRNDARAGGGLNLGQATTTCQVIDCDFVANTARLLHGGALRANDCAPEVERCLFYGNHAGTDGGAIVTLESPGAVVRGCTFFANHATRDAAHLEFFEGPGVLENCIFAGGIGGGGVALTAGTLIQCCDAWDNEGGNYLGIPDPTGSDGNISLDPLFCGVAGGDPDFTLRADSPCAPHEPRGLPCGLIGARPVGCDPAAIDDPGRGEVRVTAWGRIKSAYRPR